MDLPTKSNNCAKTCYEEYTEMLADLPQLLHGRQMVLVILKAIEMVQVLAPHVNLDRRRLEGMQAASYSCLWPC